MNKYCLIVLSIITLSVNSSNLNIKNDYDYFIKLNTTTNSTNSFYFNYNTTTIVYDILHQNNQNDGFIESIISYIVGKISFM